MENIQRPCWVCGEPYTPIQTSQKYCSKACRKKFHRNKYSQFRYDDKPCEQCGKWFTPRQEIHRYCSGDCRSSAALDRYKSSSRLYAELGMSPGTLGATGEMVTTADLLLKGYEVFRAQSPASTCDLIALKDGVALRVEVKVGKRRASGGIFYSSTRLKRENFDVLAIVLLPNEVVYEGL